MASTSAAVTPQHHAGVMISSTFKDLGEHRKALREALLNEELFPTGMENYQPIPDDDIISSSLRMIGKSRAYIGLISHRYGQVLPDARNPYGYSVTRLEYEEARQLGRPTLMFMMSDQHGGTKGDFETDADKLKKLEDFRERVMENGRLYTLFDSLEDFKVKAAGAVASLHRFLDELVSPSLPGPKPPYVPPPFMAVPPYLLASHTFQGRRTELAQLTDWAQPTDPAPLLLFEAIGGTGKSMLTWEWVNHHALAARSDWAGRFWYSFYEKGAVMADFCRQALTYMTGASLESLRPLRQPELTVQLLTQLRTRPWLLVLDGLERVLMAYHRSDAAQLADEEADLETPLTGGDGRAAIRPDDDLLLQALASAAPSKLLFTTRLLPRSLAGAARPGVRHKVLGGLQPADAEALIRACGVWGNSAHLQRYLERECGCHPLVTSVLAGLITDAYPPAPGNFDAWVKDPQGSGQLGRVWNDLTRRRSHILAAALDAAPPASQQLLATLALLAGAADYAVLEALNPHLPPPPEHLMPPEDPREEYGFSFYSAEKQAEWLADHAQALEEYHQQLADWRQAQPEATKALWDTIRDLTNRSLLQYDPATECYDLHPVVRGVAAGRLRPQEKALYGEPVLNYFTHQAHRPFHQAHTLADLHDDIQLVHVLLLLQRYDAAAEVLSYGLSDALQFQLEEKYELLKLLRPYFPNGWHELPPAAANTQAYIGTLTANILGGVGKHKESVALHSQILLLNLGRQDWQNAQMSLNNISSHYLVQNQLAKVERSIDLVLRLAENLGPPYLFWGLIQKFNYLSRLGRMAEAEAVWSQLDPMGRDWPIRMYRVGNAEQNYAWFRWRQGTLTEADLQRAQDLAEGKNRSAIRGIYGLRGLWQLQQEHWSDADTSLAEAVRMAREVAQVDAAAEAGLLLARLHLSQLTPAEARPEAERLTQEPFPPHYLIAKVCEVIGDIPQARQHAQAAYRWAWADGEPYVNRFDLTRACALLAQLGVPMPALPSYDPARSRPFTWEAALLTSLEEMKVQRAEEEERRRYMDHLHQVFSRSSLPDTDQSNRENKEETEDE